MLTRFCKTLTCISLLAPSTIPNGSETLQLIRELDADVKVVIVSGYASENLARELLQQGACDFFQKPVDLTLLLESVEQLQTE